MPVAAAWWYGGSQRLAGIEAVRTQRESADRLQHASERYNAGVLSFTAGRICFKSSNGDLPFSEWRSSSPGLLSPYYAACRSRCYYRRTIRPTNHSPC